MKNLKLFLSALYVIVITTSCTFAQNKVLTTKTFPLQSFTSVESDIVGNIIYTQSSKVSIQAEGDKELIDNLRVNEKNGVLKVTHVLKINIKNKKKLTLYISSPTIVSIDSDGVGNWVMKGKVKADNLKIEFDGVGNFEALDLESNKIKVDYEGVGNLSLGGSANYLVIESEGVGSVNAENMRAKNAIIKSSGVGSVKCYASESIDLTNSGVGSITYYGNPTVKNMKNTGVGKIKAGR